MSRCPDVLESYWARAFNIRTPFPPGSELTFSSFPSRLSKLALTHEDSHKICVYRLKNMGLPPKNIVLPL